MNSTLIFAVRRKILCKNRFTNRVKQGKKRGFALQIRAVDSAVITVLPGGANARRIKVSAPEGRQFQRAPSAKTDPHP